MGLSGGGRVFWSPEWGSPFYHHADLWVCHKIECVISLICSIDLPHMTSLLDITLDGSEHLCVSQRWAQSVRLDSLATQS